eukprot:gene5767-7176_t
MSSSIIDNINNNNNNSFIVSSTSLKRVFVSGSTGFLGSNIVEQLLIEGYEVYALYRSSRKAELIVEIASTLQCSDRLKLVKGDVTDYNSLVDGIPNQCLYVFHVAANLSSLRSAYNDQYEVNVEGTANMIEACITRGVKRLIFTSSISTFSVQELTDTPNPKLIISETTFKPSPDSYILFYARTKRLAEKLVEMANSRGLETVTLNPGYIIGRYDDISLGDVFIRIAKDPSNKIKCGGGSASFCSSRQVARAHIRAAEVAPSGSQYVLGGIHYTWKEVTENVLYHLHQNQKTVQKTSQYLYILKGYLSELLFKNPSVTFCYALMLSVGFNIDSSKAINELNYQLTDLDTMVDDCITWLKKKNLV